MSREKRLDTIIAWLAGVFGVGTIALASITGRSWLWYLSIAAGAVCLVLALWSFAESRSRKA